MSDKQKEEILEETNCEIDIKRYFYTVLHIVLSFFAVYLSYKCNEGFNLSSFLVAIFFPYVYIVYKLATRGLCIK